MSSATSHSPRIVLTGFSGTGKSSVAPLVAQALRLRSGQGWRCLDTDAMVEEAAGKPIARIFAEEGEARFREREQAALRQAVRETNVVIALGGGAILSPQNRALLADGCFLVCLDAPIEALLARNPEGRPLLAGDDPLAQARSLKAFRHPYYALADAVIDTAGRTPNEVAQAVVKAWEASSDGCTVRAAGGRSQIVVGWGSLQEMGDLMSQQGLSGRAFVVSDSAVHPLYGPKLRDSLARAGFEVRERVVPAGEASKSLRTAAALYDWLVREGTERGSPIVALGGGMITDLAGYVAATYARGVPLVYAPTSLLGMVDAAIGGKVAVNHRRAKNMIGAFYQPRLVVEDVSLLKSLPQRELTSGWAEVIKHALIMNPELMATLEANASALTALQPELTTALVRRSAALKAAIVSEDEREETGLRMILNYGHTIGHALEAASDYALLHGEAVAVGMAGAAMIGQRLGVTPAAVAKRQAALISRFGLPDRASGLNLNRVLKTMALDKKARAKSLRWVLLEDVGRAIIRSDVPLELVKEVVRELIGE